MDKKKSVRKYERETRDESQLRRRFSIDAKIETPRTTGARERAVTPPTAEGRGPVSGFGRRQHTKPIPLPDPGPGFLINEPEDDSSGVPTPKPRLPASLVPKRLMDERKVLQLPLDHRAGFVLTLVDGVTNIRTMTDVCGMPSEELNEVIDKLVELKVIKLT